MIYGRERTSNEPDVHLQLFDFMVCGRGVRDVAWTNGKQVYNFGDKTLTIYGL